MQNIMAAERKLYSASLLCVRTNETLTFATAIYHICTYECCI